MLRLALAFCLLASSAEAASMQFRAVYNPNDRVLTREQSTLRNAQNLNISPPAYFCDYTKGVLCGAETWYRRLASNWTYRNSAGYITYAPNNLFASSANPTGTRTIATDGNGKYVLHCESTGSIAYSGTASGSLNCGGVDRLLTPTQGTITLTVTPPVLHARFSEVMFETSMRAVDNYETTASAWLPPRIDANGWLLEGIVPICCGEGTTTYPDVTNLILYSNALSGSYYAPASSSTTVAAAPGITSPDGTADSWLVTNVNNTNDGLALTNAVTVTTGGDYAFSQFLKRNTANWVMLDFFDPAGPTNRRAWYNIQTGALGTNGCGDCTVSMSPDPSGNGWYRLVIGVANYTPTGVKPTMKLVAGDNSTTGCVCSVYSYGWQLDNHGAGAFSYSPTNGFVAARAPETAWSTDTRFTSASALVVEMGSLPQGRPGETRAPILSFNSGPWISEECGVQIYCPSPQDLVNTGVAINSSGGLETSYATGLNTATTSTWTGRNRFAVMLTTETTALSLNGGPVVSAPRVLPALSGLNVWFDILGGYVRSIATYPAPVPFYRLQEKSVVGSVP